MDEKSAVLVESDGSAKVVGNGKGAYFLTITTTPEVYSAGKPLTVRDIGVCHARGSQTQSKFLDWDGRRGLFTVCDCRQRTFDEDSPLLVAGASD
jgi:hypothetical protein